MLIPIGHLLKPIGEVALRELPPGVLKIILRQGEVQSGTTRVAMVAMVAMAVVVVVVVVEQITQETSGEASRETCEWQETEHSFLSCLLGVPAPASCRRSGAC
jgi:hypothetical protein